MVLFGFGVGLMIGLTGMGGGSLMTPLLIIFLGVKPVLAIGTDLAYGAITKSVGAWRHWKLKNVDLSLAFWLALGSVPGSLVGVGLVGRLHRLGPENVDQLLQRALGVSLILVSVSILSRALLGSLDYEVESVQFTAYRRLAASTIGLAVGVVLGLTSVGSGAFVGLALILFFRLQPHRVVGTDVFHAAVLLWVAGLAHLALGHVDIRLMWNILLGSIPGVWIGSGWTGKLPTARLRFVLSVVLMASGLALLAKSGCGASELSAIGVLLLLGVSWWRNAQQKV